MRKGAHTHFWPGQIECEREEFLRLRPPRVDDETRREWPQREGPPGRWVV